MTREQFSEAMVYLYAGLSKPVEAHTMRVYFDLLGDLPHEIFQAACRQVLLSHKWNTFPTIAELRAAATEMTSPALSPADAWAIALEVAPEIDLDIVGPFHVNGSVYEDQMDYVLKKHKVPRQVVEAMKAYGLRDFCYPTDPVGVVRGHFLKIVEQKAEESKRKALMPPSLRDAIENGRGLTDLREGITAALAGIGKEVA